MAVTVNCTALRLRLKMGAKPKAVSSLDSATISCEGSTSVVVHTRCVASYCMGPFCSEALLGTLITLQNADFTQQVL